MVRKNFIRAARAGLVKCDPGRSMSSSVSFPAVVHCLRTFSLVAVDLGPTGGPRGTSSGGVGGREPLPAKAVGPAVGFPRSDAGARLAKSQLTMSRQQLIFNHKIAFESSVHALFDRARQGQCQSISSHVGFTISNVSICWCKWLRIGEPRLGSGPPARARNQ